MGSRTDVVLAGTATLFAAGVAIVLMRSVMCVATIGEGVEIQRCIYNKQQSLTSTQQMPMQHVPQHTHESQFASSDTT